MTKTTFVSLKIFFVFFIFRYLFIKISGFDNFELQPDSYWFNNQSDEVIKGNFNLLRPLFITAPLFTYSQALIKFLFMENWIVVLEFLQISFASLAGVYFYFLSKIILGSSNRSYISTFIYCFYPLAFWYTGTFTQDMWFQGFLIIFFYYFLYSLKYRNLKHLVISALVFCLTFHTKSHILLFSPFIPLIILLRNNLNIRMKVNFIILFIFISTTSTLPYGIYNLKVNNTYVLGSSGLGGTLIQGNNDEAYLNHLKLEELSKEQIERFRGVNYKIHEDIKDELIGKSPKDIQKIYTKYSFNWIKNNPKKKN